MLLTQPNCTECPFAKNGQPNNPVFGEGPLYDPLFVIIGEGPGDKEVEHKRPFVGRTGKLVDAAFRMAEVDRSKVRIENSHACKPPKGASEKDKQAASKACKPYVLSVLECSSEAPILALGKVAAETLLEKPVDILEDSGASYKWNNRWVTISLHPSAVLRSLGTVKHPDAGLWSLAGHIGKQAKIGKDPYAVIKEKDVLTELADSARAVELLQQIRQSTKKWGYVACDTETYTQMPLPFTALNAPFALLRCIGFATPDLGISIDWKLTEVSEVLALVRELLTDASVAKIFHNLAYDLTVLSGYGFVLVGELHDTMLQHHVLFPGAYHRLQVASGYYQTTSPWKSEYRVGGDSMEELTRYNGKDTLATGRMHRVQGPLLKLHKVEEVYDNDRLMAQVASRMTRVGMPVDRDENDALNKEFTAKIEEHREKLEQRVEEIGDEIWRHLALEQALVRRKKDPPEYEARIAVRYKELKKLQSGGKLKFNGGSGNHIAALCAALGSPLQIRTAKGKISTTKDILEEAAAAVPLVASLTVYKENLKLRDDFVVPLFDHEKKGVKRHGWAVNGRIHPIWKVMLLPGRWASESPMVQNIPKEDPKTGRPNLRRQYKAPPGRILVGFDFAQMHPRIIAAMSGDGALLEIFRNNLDIHKIAARAVWPHFDSLPADEQKKLRDWVKKPEYTFFYGGAETTAWIQAAKATPGLQLSVIEEMYRQWRKKFVGVIHWHKRLLKAAGLPPYETRDAFGGRRLTFHLGAPSPSDVLNFPVLSTETRIMQKGITAVLPRLKEFSYAEIIHNGHDSLIFETLPDDAERLEGVIRECFEIDFMGVKMKIDTGIGQSWAEA